MNLSYLASDALWAPIAKRVGMYGVACGLLATLQWYYVQENEAWALGCLVLTAALLALLPYAYRMGDEA